MRRKAIIVGCNGQDGRFLSKYLEDKQYELALLGKEDLDITNPYKVRKFVSEITPNEIYYLAACHHSSEEVRDSDDILLKKSLDIHMVGAINFLEAITLSTPDARFFYASSSHIFSASNKKINENTLPRPEGIYALTKFSGMLACEYYRQKRNVFAVCGILFNHESNLRPAKYLSRKIVIAAAEISQKRSNKLHLGNLDVGVDWGYAPDYVDAMYRILQVEQPRDYVIATGKKHTVRQFVEIAFSYVGLDYRDYVTVQPELLTKNICTRIGSSVKLQQDTGWLPSLSFNEMVTLMIDNELTKIK